MNVLIKFVFKKVEKKFQKRKVIEVILIFTQIPFFDYFLHTSTNSNTGGLVIFIYDELVLLPLVVSFFGDG